jgi:hypothetical protein
MVRTHTITIAVAIGLLLGAGIASAQNNEIFAAEGSINDAIAYLQKSGEERYSTPSPSSLDTRRVRALAYLLLAKSELQDGFPLGAGQPLKP